MDAVASTVTGDINMIGESGNVIGVVGRVFVMGAPRNDLNLVVVLPYSQQISRSTTIVIAAVTGNTKNRR